MNDFYSRYSVKAENPLRVSFDVYLNDRHAGADLITGMTCNEARGLLRDIREHAPHVFAKCAAIRFPWDDVQANATEHGIQELLPLHDEAMDAAWEAIRPTL